MLIKEKSDGPVPEPKASRWMVASLGYTKYFGDGGRGLFWSGGSHRCGNSSS